MGDIAITAANVVAGSGATQISGTAGETITAGMVCYLKASDTRWWKAQADGTAAESGSGATYGIALNGASAGQPITIDSYDPNGITIGGTCAAGQVYVISATAGGIALESDITSGQYMTIVGIGISTTKIMTIQNAASGIAHA